MIIFSSQIWDEPADFRKATRYHCATPALLRATAAKIHPVACNVFDMMYFLAKILLQSVVTAIKHDPLLRSSLVCFGASWEHLAAIAEA